MAFITGRPVSGLDGGHALRRLIAMKLEEVGADALGHACDQLIVGIDHDGDGADLAAGDGGKHARLLELDIARALGEEDEPDEVGAGFGRFLDDGRRPHAADFDLDRHFRLLR